MYNSKQKYGSLAKSFDIFDKESLIREYILDNVFVCIFMYILFYFAVWYAHKVIKKIEAKNQEMLVTVESNKSKLDDLVALKDKSSEYDEIVTKTRSAQRFTTRQLDNEIKKLNLELVSTVGKLNELERFLEKWKLWKSSPKKLTKKDFLTDSDFSDEYDDVHDSIEDVKVMDPSFPPTQCEPAPRKYGVFARPPKTAVIHSPYGKTAFK